jgi:glutamine synthetase
MSGSRRARIEQLAEKQASATTLMAGHRVVEEFGKLSFGLRTMKQHLPKKTYREFEKGINSPSGIDPQIADVVANAMKSWAMDLGATHFTHWFQPITVAHQAEKHDAFLMIFPGQDTPLLEFSGADLIRGEPDGSSFPSGGLRQTHEARGYTFWDPTSPAFIRMHPGGQATLCIPTAFCSWTGEALDQKTPLLRSTQALSDACLKLLRLSGDKRTKSISATLGCEQEFFLIDRAFALQRPDLLLSGRTVMGAPPAKGQELDDHYFAQMPERVMSCIQDVEAELWRLGIPAKTRHNEVAPSQYEMAPIFENASVSADHNLVMMDVLDRCAKHHDLHFLPHEKPFAGINGSGKHNNWSMATNRGENLLEPGRTPADNGRFLTFLTAIIKAVDIHQDTLRFSMANAGQEHRLGANEAPPAIISVYLGEELDAVCKEIMDPKETAGTRSSSMQIGVHSIPNLKRDRTDRNRTSPFAFTGNKFEFRAVGSSQNVALPAAVMNSIVADTVKSLTADIETEMKSSSLSFDLARQEVCKKTLTQHYRIVNNGDGYSSEWPAEAKKRGLLNLASTPEAISVFTNEKNIELFTSLKVLTAPEMAARSNILLEQYAMQINIEGGITAELGRTHALPAAARHQTSIAATIQSVKGAGGNGSAAQLSQLNSATEMVDALLSSLDALDAILAGQSGAKDSDPMAWATYMHDKVVPAMGDVRKAADRVETQVDDAEWPLPKYREMIFLK